MEYLKLNNEHKMPMDGIGVFLLSPAEAEKSVRSALEDGVRLIDTANAYMNEKAVGRAIRASGVSREEIFLVTKLWPTVYEEADAVEKSLERLGTDYVDLMFLHQPAGSWRAAYKTLEKAYKAGRIRAIGLSNFPQEALEEILATAEIKPQMVQVEAHPYFPQTELKKFLAQYNMGLMAWYPLGHGDKNLIKESVFTRLAEKYGKSNAQIILRWHIQQGNVVFPGSRNPAHVRSNFDIFDFHLTSEEMDEIGKLNKNVRYYNPAPEDVQKYASMELDFDAQE